MTSSHYHEPLIRAENDQKDLIIAQLKQESFELRQKERDYRALNDQYLDLQHNYNQLADQRVTTHHSHTLQKRNETELQSRIEYQFSSSRTLKIEAEDLRAILEDM